MLSWSFLVETVGSQHGSFLDPERRPAPFSRTRSEFGVSGIRVLDLGGLGFYGLGLRLLPLFLPGICFHLCEVRFQGLLAYITVP